MLMMQFVLGFFEGPLCAEHCVDDLHTFLVKILPSAFYKEGRDIAVSRLWNVKLTEITSLLFVSYQNQCSSPLGRGRGGQQKQIGAFFFKFCLNSWTNLF